MLTPGNKKNIIEEFKVAIRNENLKVTSQRVMVLQNLLDNPSHRECEEIFQDLHQKGITVSRATIYRTLDIAVKYRFARKLDFGEGKVRYENRLNKTHHDHIICTRCGKITEFFNEDIERIQHEICEAISCQLIKHAHQLFVICSECQKN